MVNEDDVINIDDEEDYGMVMVGDVGGGGGRTTITAVAPTRTTQAGATAALTTTSSTTMSSYHHPPSDMIRERNWYGRVPVLISLASTSLSSPTSPSPIHILVSRQTFLHIGLEDVVLRMNEFAPTAMIQMMINSAGVGNSNLTNTTTGNNRVGGSETKTNSPTKNIIIRKQEPDPGTYGTQASSDDDENDDNSGGTKNKDSSVAAANSITTTAAASSSYPVCWFEDEETQIPLRWHLFVGVLHDQQILKRRQQQQSRQQQSSSCDLLPWRIRLHFNSYPATQILPLECGGGGGCSNGVLSQIKASYKNSLKQALCLQSGGNSKLAMSLTKESHNRLWDSICTGKYALYQQVHEYEPNLKQQMQQSSSSSQFQQHHQQSQIPIRLYVNAQPPIQKSCRCIVGLTLGNILGRWLPEHFFPHHQQQQQQQQQSSANGSTTEAMPAGASTATVAAKTVVGWMVCGIQPPLSTPLTELWSNLCHPDHFLYIVVQTN